MRGNNKETGQMGVEISKTWGRILNSKRGVSRIPRPILQQNFFYFNTKDPSMTERATEVGLKSDIQAEAELLLLLSTFSPLLPFFITTSTEYSILTNKNEKRIQYLKFKSHTKEVDHMHERK